jgi:LPXTG-motif cell wall-anchored protein
MARPRAAKAVLAGFGGAVLGMLLGLIAGANIGGNWFTSASFAGQHGYEATSLLGAVIGAVALGAAGVWLALRRRRTSQGGAPAVG